MEKSERSPTLDEIMAEARRAVRADETPAPRWALLVVWAGMLGVSLFLLWAPGGYDDDLARLGTLLAWFCVGGSTSVLVRALVRAVRAGASADEQDGRADDERAG